MFTGHEAAIETLFRETFGASEGDEEGALIGNLAAALMRDTAANDLMVCMSWETDALTGAIIFSRLTYSDDSRSVFVLGPVAVAPTWQGQGVGQNLLRYGLEQLRAKGAQAVMTYGDPNYYSKVGFMPVSETDAAAPYALQYPQGWQGQSLEGTDFLPLRGTCTCVAAFDDPGFW